MLFVAFIVAQTRVREPMLPLSLFRIPSFTGVQLGAFAIAGSQFALFLYITLYLQNILGLLAARGRAPLSADHACLVLRRADRPASSWRGSIRAS